MSDTEHQACPKCREYWSVRGSVVAYAIAARTLRTGELVEHIVDRFMVGVHDRHLAGLSILPVVAA